MNWLELVRPTDIAKEIAKNQLFAVPLVRSLRMKLGRTLASNDPAECARFAHSSFEQLANAIGGARALDGLDVLELGPGDSLALGLLLLLAGARRYIALDRFLGDVHSQDARKVYEELLRSVPPVGMERMPRFEAFPSEAHQVRLIREPVESFAEEGIADVIVSYNVLEHVYDLRRAVRSMRRMLRPGGVMIHRVDYSAHDVWRSYDKPLAFLAIPDAIWWAMGSARGTPNRLRHGQVVSIMTDAGFQTETTIVEQFSDEAVADIARFLTHERRAQVDTVAAAIIVAKPAAAESVCSR